MDTIIGILSTVLITFYFVYRLFWSEKTIMSWIKGDEEGAEYARRKLVGWPIFALLLIGVLLIFLYIALTGNNILKDMYF